MDEDDFYGYDLDHAIDDEDGGLAATEELGADIGTL